MESYIKSMMCNCRRGLYMDILDVMIYSGCSRTTIWRKVSSGDLEVIKIGRRLFFKRSNVIKLFPVAEAYK